MTENLRTALKQYADLCENHISLVFDKLYSLDEYSGKNKPFTSPLADSMKYSLLAGGKRLRPYLTMEVCKMLCGDEKRAISYATALEMIHTYSLIHDDLPCMDNDTMRRGLPTNHVKFGEATALLAGDSLLTDAFYVLCDNNLSAEQNCAAVKLLSKCAGSSGMALGQQIDLSCEGKAVPSYILNLLDLKKTGCLFNAACGLGCIAAGVFENTEIFSALRDFSSRIGLAFQITDDVLDVTGDKKLMGKTLGKDSEQNKNTYVSIYGIKDALMQARNQVNYAVSKLDILDDNPSKANLVSLANYILTRNN